MPVAGVLVKEAAPVEAGAVPVALLLAEVAEDADADADVEDPAEGDGMVKGTVPPLLRLTLLVLPLEGSAVTESVDWMESGMEGLPSGMVDVTVSVLEGLKKVSVTTVV